MINLMQLNEFSDDELKALVRLRPCTERSTKILDEAALQQSVDMLIDYADRLYWLRRLRRTPVLSHEDVDELLSKPTHFGARKVLGEAANEDRLTDDQLDRIYHDKEAEDEDSFVRKQVEARRSVRQILALPATNRDAIFELLARLSELKTGWAVLELANQLPFEILDEILEWLPNTKISRGYRHDIREAIKRRKQSLKA